MSPLYSPPKKGLQQNPRVERESSSYTVCDCEVEAIILRVEVFVDAALMFELDRGQRVPKDPIDWTERLTG